MTCAACGRALEPEARFCRRCGAARGGDRPAPPSPLPALRARVRPVDPGPAAVRRVPGEATLITPEVALHLVYELDALGDAHAACAIATQSVSARAERSAGAWQVELGGEVVRTRGRALWDLELSPPIRTAVAKLDRGREARVRGGGAILCVVRLPSVQGSLFRGAPALELRRAPADAARVLIASALLLAEGELA